MSKRYCFQARDSKANASAAFSQGASVRVQHLKVDPTTHKFSVVEVVIIHPKDHETLTKGIIYNFGVLHAQRDQLNYEVGR